MKRSHIGSVLLAAVVVLVLPGCMSWGAQATPVELKQAVQRQAVSMEVLVEHVEAQDAGWTNTVDLLDMLKAARDALVDLERFYYPDLAPADEEGGEQ